MSRPHHYCIFFFFNDTATTEIYTLSLHDALPIFPAIAMNKLSLLGAFAWFFYTIGVIYFCFFQLAVYNKQTIPLNEKLTDRKSTRLNSSHANISYAVFCLKKKKKII